MKEQLNFSFKKVSSGVIIEDQQRVYLFKIIFCFEFANLLKRNLMIENIDEVLLSNSTKYKIEMETHAEHQDLLFA